MTRYCLEVSPDAPIIHRLSCTHLDLGTLLGSGCLADLGEFPQLAIALSAIAREHPHALPCPECCELPAPMLPKLWKPAGLPAIVRPPT